jgi:regulator of protease activity HflC (stomatin/prohibitin superfamily)
MVSTVGNVSTMLNHFITEQDFLTKEGQDIPFTLVVVYDLTEDGSRLDEKILNTAVYKVSNQQAVTGFLTATQQRLVLLVHTIL